jgi:hypothetical protein
VPRDNRTIPLRNRLKSTLALTGETVASWARNKGHHESLVWMNLSGDRYSAQVRADLAAVLRTTVKKLDEEIGAIAAQRAEESTEKGAA